MDLNTYYKHARQMQSMKEEQDHQAEEKRHAELKDAWKNATSEIRSIFPIDGIRIFESEPQMTQSFPQMGGNYSFDVVLPDVKFTPIYDEARSMEGIIRVALNCRYTYGFVPVRYYVWVDGNCTHFSDPHKAFLACCAEMGYQPDS